MTTSLELDTPLTSMGRTLIQPIFDSVINCTMSLKHPINPRSIRAQLSNSILLKHPRFCSLMVKDSYGRERWHKTDVDLDKHIIVHHNRFTENDESDEDAVNDYVANLCYSSPLPKDKPLWEIHLLLAHNVVVLRMHHALGDGTSLMSILLSCSDIMRTKPEKTSQLVGKGRKWNMWTLMKVIWYTLVYVMEYVCTSFWRSDKPTTVSGGAGVELWPRALATARFSLDDMKIVKQAVPNATINDVLFGVISSGVSKYLETASPKAPKTGHQLTGLAMVNLRPQGGIQDLSELMDSKLYGNKLGMILFPIYYQGGDDRGSEPIQFVKTAKSLMDKKKLSYEALFSLKVAELTTFLFGIKLTNYMHSHLFCNTSFLISNIMGPPEEITFGSNPVKYIRVTTSSLPHAFTMHMVSYAGMADLQIQVAKGIIPQPKLLVKCFEDALLEMKEAALKTFRGSIMFPQERD